MTYEWQVRFREIEHERNALKGQLAEMISQRNTLLAVLETWLQEWEKFKAIFLTSPSMCAIADKMQLILAEKRGWYQCESCNSIHTPEEPVQYIRDPFIWEIDNKCVMRWLCIACEQERCDDI